MRLTMLVLVVGALLAMVLAAPAMAGPFGDPKFTSSEEYDWRNITFYDAELVIDVPGRDLPVIRIETPNEGEGYVFIARPGDYWKLQEIVGD